MVEIAAIIIDVIIGISKGELSRRSSSEDILTRAMKNIDAKTKSLT
jgi:hypothetical protein